jgi:hypothetical protein
VATTNRTRGAVSGRTLALTGEVRDTLLYPRSARCRLAPSPFAPVPFGSLEDRRGEAGAPHISASRRLAASRLALSSLAPWRFPLSSVAP